MPPIRQIPAPGLLVALVRPIKGECEFGIGREGGGREYESVFVIGRGGGRENPMSMFGIGRPDEDGRERAPEG